MAVPAGEPLRDGALPEALAGLRARSARAIGGLRFAGWLAFLALAAFLGLVRGLPDWRSSLPLHLGFALVAGALLLLLSSPRTRFAVAAAVPVVDVLMVWWLQSDSLPRSPFPAGVAGWSLGPFVLLVLLASLTLRPHLIYATALVAAICEGLLQRQAAVGAGAVAASAIVLFLAAAATDFAARRIEALVTRLVSEQVQVRLAEERSAELERAHAGTAEAKAQLEEQHARLLAAQHEAEVLSSLLVHDMKSPLSTLVMRLELAQRDVDGKPELQRLQKDLKIARVQAQRLLGMIEDLLAIARLERGTLEARPRQVDVARLLESVALAFESLAQTLKIAIAAAVEPGLAGRLDSELMERVLENLVSNALRFVGEGQRVELSASLAGGQLQLAVRNNGPAIEPALRAQLFERFSGLSERGRGNAGLGLYFCRLVAEAHGGAISLEDAPGWNVSFVIRLPQS